VTADGKQWSVKRMEAAEIEKLEKSPRETEKQLAGFVKAAAKNEQDGRWVAFRPTQDFPTDAQIRVEIARGTPSAEGPNLTKQDQHFEFRTYPPLRIEDAQCGYNNNCVPGQAFVIDFNNPLDTDKFDESWISVSPDIPGLKIVQSGDRIIVQGATKAR